MFRWFESLIDPYKNVSIQQPPDQLFGFYLHFARQIWPLLLLVVVVGFLGSFIEVVLFAFLGQLVDMAKNASSPGDFFSQHGRTLLMMTIVTLIVRPVFYTAHSIVVRQGVVPNFTHLIRWQTHRYVLRQSLNYFQNDFAGRIASRIVQTGRSLRESIVQIVDAVWYVIIYTAGALYLFFQNDPKLVLPLLVWLIGYIGCLVYFVPRLKNLSTAVSEAGSTLNGRIVDSYTNVMTVKLFAHTQGEDAYAAEAMDDLTAKYHAAARMITVFEGVMIIINGFLIVGTCGLALWLWSHNAVTLGAVALATSLVIRINGLAGWIMWVMTSIFENIGVVQEGMTTISRPIVVADEADAADLNVTRGEVQFENVKFHYGRDSGLIDNLSLTIRAGEKVGLVGRSGAGKSTLANLLLRFYDLEGGRILIDGQDIGAVTQDSLRAQIGVVTQDTSLFHRSVADNIRYGRPEASDAEVIAVSKRAHAHAFIRGLEDKKGHRGYEAQVGERGVKLSGGQRQRVAIARVLLKNAPLLILDEATSALDSEVEAAIQEQLYNLMEGKTVIAIAHRLSTIAAMDRLIIMDRGHIVEDGSHEALLKHGGIYAQLWKHQSGGFLLEEQVA
jgi:ATP-binding cassette, subfamily B, multidrug efflux pump